MNIRAQMRKWLGLDDLVTTKQLSYVIVTIKDQGAITRKAMTRDIGRNISAMNARRRLEHVLNYLWVQFCMGRPDIFDAYQIIWQKLNEIL